MSVLRKSGSRIPSRSHMADEVSQVDTLRERNAVAPADTWPRIEGYEILELVGRGGMGRVFKARHQALGRIVALKVLVSDADASVQARFRSESQAVAQLHHPHVAQIFETSADEHGQPYFAMEY